MPSRHHRRSNGVRLTRAMCRSLDIATTPYVSGVGGLTTFNNYWSSSQNNANNAWKQNVGNGGGSDWQNTDNKNNTNHVRPVRGFHHGNDVRAWVGHAGDVSARSTHAPAAT